MRPQSAHTFSAKDYEEAKRRVRRLDATCGKGGAAAQLDKAPPLRANGEKLLGEVGIGSSPGVREKVDRLKTPPAGKQRHDGDFVENLKRNITELRECIIGRLSPYPQLQGLMDGDFKEMQLHMDRLFIQNQIERDRHAKDISELMSAFEQQFAADKQQHEANMKTLQLATMQQREHQAEKEALERAALESQLQEERKKADEREVEWEKWVGEQLEEQRRRLQDEFEHEREQELGKHLAAVRAAREEERERGERAKEQALEDLAESLIPKIEEELVAAHRDEIRKYHRYKYWRICQYKSTNTDQIRKYHRRCEVLKSKVEDLEQVEASCMLVHEYKH